MARRIGAAGGPAWPRPSRTCCAAPAGASRSPRRCRTDSALSDWLGHRHYRNDAYHESAYNEGDITLKAGNAGALRIEGTAKNRFNGETSAVPATIKSDVIPAGDRLNLTGGARLVWMQRVSP
jgi:hypothetical protein